MASRCDCEGHDVALVLFQLEMHGLNLITSKHQTNQNQGTVHISMDLFKNASVTKDNEKLIHVSKIKGD